MGDETFCDPCWDCYSCVTISPASAKYATPINNHPASHRVIHGEGDIKWTIKFRNGMMKQFTFKVTR